MRLVITEKPSVARDLAGVLGARSRRDGWLEGPDLRITWCLGHLVELQEPGHYEAAWKRWSLDALPMIPERFELRLRRDTAERFAVIRRLLEDPSVDEVVNACDAGREGELIFRYVLQLAGAAPPVRRLWLASLTPAAIRQAWGRLRPGADFDPLADAARSRSEADWLVGLNATRAMTCLARQAGGGRVLSIGRVQTPTLAMVVDRDRAIEAFVPEPTFQVRATFRAQAPAGPATWEATWFRPRDGSRDGPPSPEPRRPKGEAPPAERLPSRQVAEALAEAVQGRTGLLEVAETRRIVDRPPPLYDLTSLQRRANQRYGLPAQRTLDVAQALYERHKLITYPRTDARHLTPDQIPELPGLARGLARMEVYRPHAQAVLARFDDGFRPGPRVVDASEVGDHHAILPTGRPAHELGLSPDEKRVFDLVARRFLAVLSEDALFDRTTVVVAVDGPLPEPLEAPARFRARGRVCVREGWRAVDPPGRSTERELPRLTPGDPADAVETQVVEGETRPPRPYDDASLLKAMETAGKELDDAALRRALRSAGLGTPATRAAILQTLLQRGFVRRDGRHLRATERGTALIEALPTEILKSAALTGRWERRLAGIAEGRDSRAAFMRDVAELVTGICADIGQAEAPTGPAFAAPEGAAEPVGTCPRCGGQVVERPRVWACGGCPLVIFREMSGRTLSRRMLGELLKTGRTRPVKGFRSQRTGRRFTAGVELRDDGSVGLYFPEAAALAPCPRCDGAVRERGKVWACDAEDCEVVVFREMSGRALTEEEARTLVRTGRVGPLTGFRSRRTGRDFEAVVVLGEDGRAGFDFGGGGADRTPSAPAGPVPVEPEAADPTGMRCPACGEGRLLRGRTAWGCDRWSRGCTWRLPYDTVSGPAEAVARVRAAAGDATAGPAPHDPREQG
jgi:DNA topoisomerase III